MPPSLLELIERKPSLVDCLYIVCAESAIFSGGKYLMIVRGDQEANAPGTLSLPGGKVEKAGDAPTIIEETLRREIREEAGVEIFPQMAYVESKSFVSDDGKPVIDLVFLSRYQSGEPATSDPGEVASVQWLSLAEVLAHPNAPVWTKLSLEASEKKRLELGW